jgi:cell division protein ZapA
MPQVTLQINGQPFTVVCKDGEEAHLQAMSQEVNRRLDRVRSETRLTTETRLLVLVSLIMADEIADLEAKVAGLEAKLKTKVAPRLKRLTETAEAIADGKNPANPVAD